MKLKGRVALITGGGSGIGAAIALAFAREGARVAIGDVQLDFAVRVGKEVESAGSFAIPVRMDVSDAGSVAEAVDAVLRQAGPIDILVNNAGICRTTPIDAIPEEEWDEVLSVNLKGVFLCSRAVMGGMRERRYGRIINLASLSAKVGGIAVGAHYAASKAGVICLTKSLAKALASFGVTVNAIAPGVIGTAMLREITGGDYERYLGTIPLGRIGTVEDVAEAALFLASDGANYITGEIMDVNGGQLMD